MVRFDDTLEIAKDFATKYFKEFGAIYLVRDLTGHVSVALNASKDQLEGIEELSAKLHHQLGAYSPGESEAVLTKDDLILEEDVFDSDELIPLQEDPTSIYLIDHIMNNQDWLREPLRNTAPLPTAVAFSLKGGVGRSTTFAALAYHLAELNYKVLSVDLDLEAPGLQSLLLRQDSDGLFQERRPDFGVVDWLLESRVDQDDAELFEEMLGSVDLPSGTPGAIQVIPAFGKNTKDYVAKLGRAYISEIGNDGVERGFAEGILGLLCAANNRAESFDVALLDARAGMHDIGAAAVTRLGAHAFLFARNDLQTWTAYQRLFQHLRWSPAVTYGMPDNDLRWRLSTVGAMTGVTDRDFEDLRGRSYSTWQWLYDEEEEPSPGTPEETDQSMPHWPLSVYSNEKLQGASFHDPDMVPTPTVMEQAYRDFFEVAKRRLLPDSGADE